MNYLNTTCYAVIFVACLAHLNRVHKLPLPRILAFALITAGAAGSGIEPWCSDVHRDAHWWHLMFNAGVALLALFYFGIDRRKKPTCPPNIPAECLAQIERRFQRTP